MRKQLAKLQAEFNVILQDKELIEKKISKMKDTNENEKIEHDKYIKILEENNKELMDKYENINKENEELKSEHINELTELKNKNDDDFNKMVEKKKKNIQKYPLNKDIKIIKNQEPKPFFINFDKAWSEL